jgi:hypothetical protein
MPHNPFSILQGKDFSSSIMTSIYRNGRILNSIGGVGGVYLPYYTSDVFYKHPEPLQSIIIHQESSTKTSTKNTPLSSVVVHHFPPSCIAITIS